VQRLDASKDKYPSDRHTAMKKFDVALSGQCDQANESDSDASKSVNGEVDTDGREGKS